jgi:hypothetical protein
MGRIVRTARGEVNPGSQVFRALNVCGGLRIVTRGQPVALAGGVRAPGVCELFMRHEWQKMAGKGGRIIEAMQG